MRISKTLVASCAIALGAVLIGNAASDTEAQAKAREALRKKLAEEGQPASATADAPVAPVAPAAVVAPVPPARRPAPAPGQEDKLREALRQKIQELNQQEPAGVTPAAAAVTPVPAVAPAPVTPPPPPVTPPATVVVTTSAAATAAKSADPTGRNEEQLREATRQKIQELNQPGDVEAATPGPKASDEQAELMRQRLRETIAAEKARKQTARATVAAQPPVTNVEEAKTPKKTSPQLGTSGFTPLVAPPSGLAGSKEARLAELTRRYRADDMTPEEYHKERAKLIAEP